MSDYMLLEYLRGKGKGYEDRQMYEDFKNYMRAKGSMRGSRRHRDYQFEDDGYNRHDWDMNYIDSYKSRSYRDHSQEGAFDEFEAKEIVSEMHHYEGDRRHTGEHFDMHKAKEVYEKYKSHFVVKASPCDVYIAINAFYHDLGSTLKQWFGSNIDEKVIMLAIAFWFKDDDYQGNKLLDYFE